MIEYSLFFIRILKSQNDNDLENNELQVDDPPFSNKKGILKETDFDSDSLKEQTSTETNEVELFKKIQVMQSMNPAIKALMNYRGKTVLQLQFIDLCL